MRTRETTPSIVRAAGVLAAGLTLTLFAGAASAQKPTPKKPPAKQPTIGTLGTAQVQGGDGLFGTTYTFARNGGVYNVAIVSAEYSIARHNISEGQAIAPKADEKLLILHLRAQNPLPHDEYFGGNFITFQTVAKDDKTRDHNTPIRLASAHDAVRDMLKPGQKFPDELVLACVVPANGPVPKLILTMGRQGTSDQVTRFFLGKAPNVVKPLAAPLADPTDPSGATALPDIPAKTAVFYPAGYFDVRLDSVAFMPGPIGDHKAGSGKQYLVATVTIQNKTWRSLYANSHANLAATLLTSDGEKETLVDVNVLKGARDERWQGRKIDPEETVTLRLLFLVPNGVTGKTLKIAEEVNNGLSHGYLLDLSGIK